jgi:hypothetical protein
VEVWEGVFEVVGVGTEVTRDGIVSVADLKVEVGSESRSLGFKVRASAKGEEFLIARESGTSSRCGITALCISHSSVSRSTQSLYILSGVEAAP